MNTRYTIALLLSGWAIGFFTGVWLMVETEVAAGEAKYKLRSHNTPPVVRDNTYGYTKIHDIRCISESEKDCKVTAIPEPSTLLLLGGGMLFFIRKRK
jgi:hypothetical protein